LPPKNPPIRESEWSRQYQVGPKNFSYESKFLSDGLEVSADDIRERWSSFSQAEQLDFAFAFQCKPTLSNEDERILLFLMKAGNEVIWSTIALMLCRHSHREAVSDFLLERLANSIGTRENYYRAVEMMADRKFLPILEEQYREYGRLNHSLWPKDERDHRSREFIQLCQTLATLTEDQRYAGVLREFLNDTSPAVRKKAQLLIERSKR
jgi:hypothetical protein